jgi:hypothetical protein
VQAESAPAPVRQVNCSPQVSADPFSCLLNASTSGEGGPFRPESHCQGIVSVLLPKIQQSNAQTQDDGAFAEAVTKSKSKKERGQNKAVLDVADLFAGQALGLLNRTVFVYFASFLFQFKPLCCWPHTPCSAGPADAARTPRASERPTRGGSEGPFTLLFYQCLAVLYTHSRSSGGFSRGGRGGRCVGSARLPSQSLL